jgi:predicted RNase H-like HicB family nuclease
MRLTATYLKSKDGFCGFIQELPGIAAHGRTLVEARESLQRVMLAVFEEQRREAEALLIGKEAVREPFAFES